ncbi:hypothetical protein FRC04_004123 [Tulasnella sp. 424]|nr:hypothetical protein FRC04_004123 [Tulasnella sp. 424]
MLSKPGGIQAPMVLYLSSAHTDKRKMGGGGDTLSFILTLEAILGAIQQLGETGVALSTLVITLHTFATVFFRWQPSRYPWLWMVVVACIWIFLLLFVVIGYVVHKGAENRGGTPYFGPTPFWCWIGSHYLGERIAGEYFWLWFCAFTSIVLYPFLFFMLRGNIDVDPDNWRRISFHHRSQDRIFGNLSSPTHGGRDAEAIRADRARNKEAMKMFWYPISYTILVGPLSINRWRSSFKPSSNAGVEKLSIVPTSVVLFIFGLSGLCNVLLFLLTRPNLLLFNVRRRLREQHAQQLSQATSTGVSFAHPRQSSGAASYPSAPGIHQRTARRREDFDEEEDSDEGYFDGRRRSDIELLDEPNLPPQPSQNAPLPPPPASPMGSPFSGGMEGPDRPGEAVRMSALGSPRASIPPFTGYENHHPGADDSTMRRTSAGSSRYTTATTSAGGTIPAGSGGPSAGGSGPSPTRFREHFHDEDVPVSGIRTIPMNQRLPKQQSMTLPVMPEPPSTMLRRQASSGEEPLLTTLPPPPDAIYSRSASRIPPSSPTAAVAPPAVPPTGYPPPDSTRSRVEEWALGTAPPQPPRGPAP